MIISVSRRTDIPAFYAEWFMNRIRAGYCTVPNPYYPEKITRVSLAPGQVDVFVFVTRNPRPLLPFIKELDRRGYRYYFQYTLIGNPRSIDPKCPGLEAALDTFQELAGQIGADKVIWRYDPIVLSSLTTPEFHIQNYASIAQALSGYTYRSVISILDVYAKARKRLEQMRQNGVNLIPAEEQLVRLGEFLPELVRTARENHMEIFSCAEDLPLQQYGVQPGSCVDAEYIERTFGIKVGRGKDPSQRKACGCVASRDIGMYDSCLHGCRYCYATSSFERAAANYAAHDPRSPSLLGWRDLPDEPSHQMSFL